MPVMWRDLLTACYFVAFLAAIVMVAMVVADLISYGRHNKPNPFDDRGD